MNHPAQPAPDAILAALDADMQAFLDAHAAFHASKFRHNQFEEAAAYIITKHREKYTAALRARCERLEGALISLKAACKDVLLPAINEAIKAGYKMETWTPEQFQWSEAMAKTDAALAQPEAASEPRRL